MSRVLMQALLCRLTAVDKSSALKCSSLMVVRNSSFGPHFVNPIYKREDLIRAKESGEAEKLAHVPIKSAKTEETCSVYYDPVVEKFTNYIMRKGKKDLARHLVSKTFETIKRIQVEAYNKETDPESKMAIDLDPVTILHKAVDNAKPVLQLTPIKRGGATYQVPIPINPKKALFLSMNWLIEQGKAEPKDVRFYVKLANELISSSKNQGKAVRKKQELHRQCEANRAYAHYRWS